MWANSWHDTLLSSEVSLHLPLLRDELQVRLNTLVFVLKLSRNFNVHHGVTQISTCSISNRMSSSTNSRPGQETGILVSKWRNPGYNFGKGTE